MFIHNFQLLRLTCKTESFTITTKRKKKAKNDFFCWREATRMIIYSSLMATLDCQLRSFTKEAKIKKWLKLIISWGVRTLMVWWTNISFVGWALIMLVTNQNLSARRGRYQLCLPPTLLIGLVSSSLPPWIIFIFSFIFIFTCEAHN